jgi:hypothetical protein
MIGRRWTGAIVYCLVCGVGLTIAAAGTSPKRRQHKAHVHGVATLNIAVEDRTATVEFESPAESVIGFEHKARSTTDQEKQAKALDLLRNKIDSMVIFDPALGCHFSPDKVDVVHQTEEHAEVHGLFAVNCDTALAGSKLRFGFTKTFPAIQTVNVQLVAATQQVGASIKRDQGEMEVPR